MRRPLALLSLAAALTIGAPAHAAEDPGRAQQWALDRIGAPTAGQGAGITVAVVDTGVDLTHVDLRDRILPGIDLVDDDAVAQDANGHGTHVAGIVAATSGNGTGIAGAAPRVSILPVRVLDADGSGGLEDVVAGIRWAIANGADVINLSLSEDAQAVLGPQLADAIREAWAAGVVPVIAAGNQYVLGSGFADEPAMVVAATTREDGKPSYSSSVGDAKWGMSAPGGEQPTLGQSGAILSTYWVEGLTDQYAYDAGTSMAAPHVAAAVATLLGLGLTPQQAVDRLLATAVDLGPPGRDDVFGAGRLDLASATASSTDGTEPTPEPAPEPSPTPTAAPGPTTAPSQPGSAPPATDPTSTTATTIEAGTSSTPTTDDDGSSETDADDAVVVDLEPTGSDDDPSTTVPAIVAAALIPGVLVAGVRVRRGQPQRDAI